MSNQDPVWEEYDKIAEWYAHHNQGLPFVPSEAVMEEIAADIDAFNKRIRDFAYARAMEGIYPEE